MRNMASITEGVLSLRRVVLLLTTMGVALVLASGVAHAAAPANDNFANAQELTGENATLSGTNVDATKEFGEPNHANPGGKSVWYKWTPQGGGPTTIDTAGSTFDTLLAVYTGGGNFSGEPTNLTEIASDDDDDEGGPGVVTSKVSFTATAGTTYRIAVDGFNNDSGADPGAAESGSITLNLASDTPDSTAPGPPVITSPLSSRPPIYYSYDRDGNITLSGTAEANSTVKIFEVSASGPISKGTTLVNSSGTWSKTLPGVPDGSHTYKVKAIDEAGNVSAFSDRCTVIVDTIAPSVTNVVPAEKATDISPGADVSVTFSEEMMAGSAKKVKLYVNGSTREIRADVTYDAATKRATLDPWENLERRFTYKAVVTTGAKDLAGNALDQNPSKEGSQKKVWYFEISR